MAIGFDTSVIGSFTVGMLLIVLGMLLLVGAILWASRAGKVKQYGQVLTVFSLVVLMVLVVAMAIKPAEVGPTTSVGTFSVISVTGVGHANYTSDSKTFTVAMRANATTFGPATFNATFNVQRTDAGPTTDIKTVTASVSQNKLTNPVTGDTYNVILPTSDGSPTCNWNLMPGSTSATLTLSAQIGLTPYQTGSFKVTITWNPSAFTSSNIHVNDVIQAGSINVGGTAYTLQVLITGK